MTSRSTDRSNGTTTPPYRYNFYIDFTQADIQARISAADVRDAIERQGEP